MSTDPWQMLSPAAIRQIADHMEAEDAKWPPLPRDVPLFYARELRKGWKDLTEAEQAEEIERIEDSPYYLIAFADADVDAHFARKTAA